MSYEYHTATTLPEALDLAARHGEDAHLVAGGTAFMLLYRQGLLRPGHVIGLRDVPELRGLTKTKDGGLTIGATVTHTQAERSPEVTAYCPALVRTFASVATVRIRNQATVGGNLAHGDPAQDPPSMLIALGAEAVVASVRGERVVPLDELFVDYLTTSLAPGEILRGVRLPALPAGTRATYVKFLPRTQDDYATVSVAAVLRLGADGGIEHVRVVLGGVGPTPMRARSVEKALHSAKPDAKRLADAAALARDDVDPLDDARGSPSYKRDMARVWTRRALAQLLDIRA